MVGILLRSILSELYSLTCLYRMLLVDVRQTTLTLTQDTDLAGAAGDRMPSAA